MLLLLPEVAAAAHVGRESLLLLLLLLLRHRHRVVAGTSTGSVCFFKQKSFSFRINVGILIFPHLIIGTASLTASLQSPSAPARTRSRGSISSACTAQCKVLW